MIAQSKLEENITSATFTNAPRVEYLANNSHATISTRENYLYNGLKPFNDTDVILFATFAIIFMIFGLIANLFTIAVIAKSKNLRSIFHFFIFSLCVSDATSALISWINLYRRTWGFDDFMLPDFLCRLYWAVDIWTSYSTALHILSFAILRLISLRWSPCFKTSLKNGNPLGLIWVSLIWFMTFICGAVPFWLFSGSQPKDRSSPTPDSKWPYCTQLSNWLHVYTFYVKIAYPIFFFAPIVFTFCLSAFVIGLMLRSGCRIKAHLSHISAKQRSIKEKQAVFQLGLIVTSFIIGYVPFAAYELYTTRQQNDTYENWWIDWHFGTVQYMCLRLSECLNPIFYHIGSMTLSIETKKFLHKRLQ